VKWSKKGLVFGPDGRVPWARHTAGQPTPLLLDDETIRVFVGFRDDDGVTRLGYVDVRANDPARILRVSERPVFDVGRGGMFDDNGVILGDVVRTDRGLRLYYVGFQLVAKAKFLAFSGIATSADNGETFIRQSEAPVLDRADEGLYIRAIHTAIRENDRWKIWYAAGSSWETIAGTPYPNYHIRYLESSNGIDFPVEGKICVTTQGREYRIGRPRVYRTDFGYEMFYTKGTLDGEYLPGYAQSNDGINWERMDDQVGLGVSAEGWDSRALSYISLLSRKDRTYAFFNGNDFGRDGFGYAVLESR
jgi:predicted GH43/DUF377 family glycosyl hydrolase